MTFTFLDLILFSGIVQGIFLMISLYFVSQKNKEANKILMIIIGFSTIIFAREMLQYQLDPILFWRSAILTECTMYLFGPFLYLYFRKLVFGNHPNNKLSFKHYIPSLLLFIYFIWTLSITTEEYVASKYTPIMFYAFLAMEVTGAVSIIVYSYLSYKIVKHLKNIENPSIYINKVSRYITFVLVGISSIAFCWAFGIFNTYGLGNFDSIISYKLIWICITIFLFTVGYFSFTQPEIVRLPIEKKIIARNRMTKEEVSDIQQKLQVLVEDEHIFMHSDLSLKILAKELGTTANNLSWLLNSIYEKTFYEYINEYRVKAFLQKVEAGEHKKQTLLSIAMDAGFNSKSTFNKTFKALMNDTPSRYIEKMYS
ncbi:helix-turn-helix domain-containing protein [Kordia sp.]|uniref:helix-turn-helix domain-containing protein n=1 Tax=Kordia sp. TaxID=1965332 RepID=UPI0025B8D379|nr:helix-turn-helix domain-containing protein [Kordia sp.]MCH2194687.1 helix-turn-helix domain-containing protein [Kordia sp.]